MHNKIPVSFSFSTKRKEKFPCYQTGKSTTTRLALIRDWRLSAPLRAPLKPPSNITALCYRGVSGRASIGLHYAERYEPLQHLVKLYPVWLKHIKEFILLYIYIYIRFYWRPRQKSIWADKV